MTADRSAARYGLIGHPISHSRSPFIHRHFASQLGQEMTYEAIDVAPEHFRERVESLREDGFLGLNVTVPLKEHAFAFASSLSARALRAEAVNTLSFGRDGLVSGDNTDGIGLLRDLTRNLEWKVAGQRILMLGAGGAARGVMQPLLEAGPAQLTVANRTCSRGEELVAAFAPARCPVRAVGLDELGGEAHDLLINATSAALGGGAPRLPAVIFAPGARAYDMMYAPTQSAFLKQAAALGAGAVSDGRGMLVEQAAESFAIWRGVRPATASVIAALSAALTAEDV